MKILYLCHRLPNAPDKGCKIRAYHELRALAKDHEVHVRSLVDRAEHVDGAAALRGFCRSVEAFPVHRPTAWLRCAVGLPRRSPATLAFFHSAALARCCAELARAESFDLVVIYSTAMMPYAAPFAGTPRVLDMVDVDSAKWAQYARLGRFALRPGYRLEATRLRRYEAAVAREVERVVLVTQHEKDLLEAVAPAARAVAIPNGVDLEHFQPLHLPKSRNPLLVFTGQMDYFPNVDGVTRFVRDVLPELRQRFADLELVIVGRSPTAAVQALGEVPGVTVTGAVEDVRPFLDRAWVAVAPLRIAQGLQNKVLEAMAMGVPVACSEQVLRGLSDGAFRDGEDLLAAPSEELAGPVARLLEDAELRGRLASSAAAKLAHAYDWPSSLERFARVCHDAVAAGRAPQAAAPPSGAELVVAGRLGARARARGSRPALVAVPATRPTQPHR